MRADSPFDIPELVDRIIDHLYDDHETLLAASSVCRSMHPSCRYHLLNDITLSHKKHIERLTEHLTANPGLGSIVHSLTFDRFNLSTREVYQLLAHIVNLKALRFSRTMISVSTDDLEPPLFSSVRCLELDGGVFGNVGHCIQMLFSFPKLDTLRVAQTASLNSINHEVQLWNSIPILPRISIRNLHIHGSYYGMAIARILIIQDLKSYSASAKALSEMSNVLSACQIAGGDLENLNIAIDMRDYAVPTVAFWFEPPVLLPKLRTLSVTWRKLENPSSRDVYLALHGLPEAISAPKLERIKLALKRWPDDSVVDHDWESLKERSLDASIIDGFRALAASRDPSQPRVQVELGHNLAGAPEDAPLIILLRSVEASGLIDLVT